MEGDDVAMTMPCEKFIVENSSRPGWYRFGADVIQIARNARTLRTPETRYASAAFPLRTSYALLGAKCAAWELLENEFRYPDMPDQHRKLNASVMVFASVFSAG